MQCDPMKFAKLTSDAHCALVLDSRRVITDRIATVSTFFFLVFGLSDSSLACANDRQITIADLTGNAIEFSYQGACTKLYIAQPARGGFGKMVTRALALKFSDQCLPLQGCHPRVRPECPG